MTERPPVYVKLIRPEGYEDVRPEALVHDAINDEFEPEFVDFPIREEGDADVPGREHISPRPDVAPPAVGPHNLPAGVSDEAEYVRLREDFTHALADLRCDCGGEAACMEHRFEAEDAMDRFLAAALPHLERAAVERWIDSLSEGKIAGSMAQANVLNSLSRHSLNELEYRFMARFVIEELRRAAEEGGSP